ncbi:hypothetical protein LOK74_07610 [Brevibacillus humidisoli]|uniref:hypothetical protein n=1 Tax=Brevibacillus humidisoli TaxID=2895522 RepID=UPI001E50F1D3|nr:hypothetical protein [Brevibacillus humidisoli]UFJ42343.1 hypothetical protein LOK74_07610 [Brevibacillus humidisoli]
MKVAIYQIANRVGMHPKELSRAIYDGEVTGEVPDGNPQSKQAWVDLLSLRNYIQWLYERERMDEIRYLKSIRHLDALRRQMSGSQR